MTISLDTYKCTQHHKTCPVSIEIKELIKSERTLIRINKLLLVLTILSDKIHIF